MSNFKKTLAAGLALALLAGCGGSNGGGSNNGGGEADGKKTVTVAINADLNTMDHHVATDGGSFVMQSLCIGGLVELDANAQPQPDLAESWDVSEDGTVYTFHLRDGLKWSNGTPLTAKDFVYGWQRLDAPNLASEYAFLLETICVKNAKAAFDGEVPLSELGVSAPDDKTFVVELTQPVGFFLGLMAFPSFFPLNQEFFESMGGDLDANVSENQYSQAVDKMLYCGPYVFSNWEANTAYTFTKNPDYWNADAQKDCVDEVVFRFAKDAQSAALSYQQGDIDVVTLTGDLVDQYKSDPGFTQRLQGYAWRLNVNQLCKSDETFKNLNLRKALSLSINRDAIANDVLKDGSIAAQGFIPRDFAYGPDGKDYRDTVGNLVEYDVAAAQEAYNKAKEELGTDSISVDILYETDSEAPGKVAENIQAMWKENLPGIEVNLVPKTKKERLALMNELDYEVGLTRWGPDYADPQTYLDLFKSDQTAYNGYYFNDAYDALLNKAETGEDAANAEARWADLIEAEKLILDDQGLIPVFQNGAAMLINPEVKGIEFHNAGVDSYRHITKG
ncbi:MAG: peptide ABC transporter substrate-binding protein [Solobacterium sp.]|nr:peptide ABC transporter substrate-binding protein [Solobacterium sp.]